MISTVVKKCQMPKNNDNCTKIIWATIDKTKALTSLMVSRQNSLDYIMSTRYGNVSN